jgi:hypothetical protein
MPAMISVIAGMARSYSRDNDQDHHGRIGIRIRWYVNIFNN